MGVMTQAFSNTPSRYEDLRNQLNALNYSYPFGHDSMDLIQTLLQEIQSSTQGYHHIKEELVQVEKASHATLQKVLPLEDMNMRLTRENAELNLEMIRLSESIDKENTKHVHESKIIENKVCDMTKVINVRNNKIQDMEREMEGLKTMFENASITTSSNSNNMVIQYRTEHLIQKQHGNNNVK